MNILLRGVATATLLLGAWLGGGIVDANTTASPQTGWVSWYGLHPSLDGQTMGLPPHAPYNPFDITIAASPLFPSRPLTENDSVKDVNADWWGTNNLYQAGDKLRIINHADPPVWWYDHYGEYFAVWSPPEITVTVQDTCPGCGWALGKYNIPWVDLSPVAFMKLAILPTFDRQMLRDIGILTDVTIEVVGSK